MQADLNKYATDLKNFMCKVVAEETELKEYAEYIEYMCKNHHKVTVANMFKAKLRTNSDAIRIDSAKDVENIHKQVAKYVMI